MNRPKVSKPAATLLSIVAVLLASFWAVSLQRPDLALIFACGFLAVMSLWWR